MSEKKFKTGVERFSKDSLVKKETIVNEIIKLEKGTNCYLLMRNRNQHNIIIDIYAVSHTSGGKIDSSFIHYFTTKEEALEFYEIKSEELKEKSTKEKPFGYGMPVSKYCEEIEEKSKKGEAVPLDTGVGLIAQAYGSISPIELDGLVGYQNPLVRKAVANNQFTSEDTLNRLWKANLDYETNLMVLNNSNTDIKILEDIIERNEHMDYVAIAKVNIVRRNVFTNFSIIFGEIES